jgi:hypothetical protein
MQTMFMCQQCRTKRIKTDLPGGWLEVRLATSLGIDAVTFCSAQCARIALAADYSRAAWDRQAEELAAAEERDQPPADWGMDCDAA